MRIHFSAPFDVQAIREVELELASALTLQALIVRLAEQVPGLSGYGEMAGDADLLTHIAFIRRGQILKWEETVYDEDVLEVVLPATGG